MGAPATCAPGKGRAAQEPFGAVRVDEASRDSEDVLGGTLAALSVEKEEAVSATHKDLGVVVEPVGAVSMDEASKDSEDVLGGTLAALPAKEEAAAATHKDLGVVVATRELLPEECGKKLGLECEDSKEGVDAQLGLLELSSKECGKSVGLLDRNNSEDEGLDSAVVPKRISLVLSPTQSNDKKLISPAECKKEKQVSPAECKKAARLDLLTLSPKECGKSVGLLECNGSEREGLESAVAPKRILLVLSPAQSDNNKLISPVECKKEKQISPAECKKAARLGLLELSTKEHGKSVGLLECSDSEEEAFDSVVAPQRISLVQSPAQSNNKKLILPAECKKEKQISPAECKKAARLGLLELSFKECGMRRCLLECSDSEEEGLDSAVAPKRISLVLSPAQSNNKMLISPAECEKEKRTSLDECKKAERCCVCQQPASARVCCACAARLKISLSNDNLNAAIQTNRGTGYYHFCLECTEIVRGDHEHHQGRTMLLRKHLGSFVAWEFTMEETCSSLFEDIERERFCHPELGRPFRLHKPSKDHPRCQTCSDLVAPTTRREKTCSDLAPTTRRETPVRYCTIDCWFKGEGTAIPHSWVSTLVCEDFADSDAFCIDCQHAFNRDKGGHENHKYLLVQTDRHSSRIEIPHDHFFAQAWINVEEIDKPNGARAVECA